MYLIYHTQIVLSILILLIVIDFNLPKLGHTLAVIQSYTFMLIFTKFGYMATVMGLYRIYWYIHQLSIYGCCYGVIWFLLL